MNLLREEIQKIVKLYGPSFYYLDVVQFSQNYDELTSAFKKYYQNFMISYSYKTNYIPYLCKMVDEKGGYAEIVSDMEYDIAIKCGVSFDKIIFNGPVKNLSVVEKILDNNGIVNVDNIFEYTAIKDIAVKKNKQFKLGLRINFDINDGCISRFGFDIKSDDFKYVIKDLSKADGLLKLKGMHLHFASRNINNWPNRATELVKLLKEIKLPIEYFSLGGGIYGKMKESLKAQFNSEIPCYDDYAKSVGPVLSKYFNENYEKQPVMFVEPGTALVGDCMKFVCPVVSIKNIRGKNIATVLGSVYNINPTLNGKNPPISIEHFSDKNQKEYVDLDFGGFTCIESDYLYKHYNGKLAVGDLVVFDNVGSYSIVLKPPFILPNFPVIIIKNGDVLCIKQKETFEDLFKTYKF